MADPRDDKVSTSDSPISPTPWLRLRRWQPDCDKTLASEPRMR